MLDAWSKWSFRAKNDLDGASILLQHNPPQLDLAIYHTQQSAEKVLKGFLAFHNQNVPRIHDVLELVEACAVIDSTFLQLRDKAAFLNPNATEFRYTDNFDEAEELADLLPDAEDVQTSIEFATTVFNFVTQKIENKTTEHAK
jgi:HEPN domain-containing protein